LNRNQACRRVGIGRGLRTKVNTLNGLVAEVLRLS